MKLMLIFIGMLVSSGAFAMAALNGPVSFVCTGGEYEVSYKHPGASGVGRLVVQTEGEEISLGPAQLIWSSMGALISADVKDLPSDVWIKFSFVLPRVQIGIGGALTFETMLVRSVTTGPVAPGVDAVNPVNEFVPVRCHAPTTL